MELSEPCNDVDWIYYIEYVRVCLDYRKRERGGGGGGGGERADSNKNNIAIKCHLG